MSEIFAVHLLSFGLEHCLEGSTIFLGIKLWRGRFIIKIVELNVLLNGNMRPVSPDSL